MKECLLLGLIKWIGINWIQHIMNGQQLALLECIGKKLKI
jgi:hypothetical protein